MCKIGVEDSLDEHHDLVDDAFRVIAPDHDWALAASVSAKRSVSAGPFVGHRTSQTPRSDKS
jgi:hypothetical protein